VWFDSQFYKCCHEEKGQIFIPYGSSAKQGKIIMMHDGFAQLGEFYRKSEDYEFSCAMHLVPESVLVG